MTSHALPRSREAAERIDAVRRVVEAARRVAADSDALTPRLVADTGLTPEGVAWAFAHHLETSPSEHELAQLVAATREASATTVILSANVFTAALRAVALAVASSPRVHVRPSRREPGFARALVEALGDPAVVLAPERAVADVDEGEIHVYGRDATIDDVRRNARPGVRVWGHGAGMGVAYVDDADDDADADADLFAAAEALAYDVVAFDQRGCLSPRMALVAGSDARAAAFAHALDGALAQLGARIPRGALDADERASARRFVDAMAFVGDVHVGANHAVAVAPVGTPLVVPPSGRHVFVVSVDGDAAARRALAAFAPAIVAVGAGSVDAAARVAPPHARLSPLGAMQRPAFDGPVDRRDGYAAAPSPA